MKIKISNFRSLESYSEDFGESGIVLISGKSGVGKSSIFEAINFALFGVGREIVTNGKTNCRVELSLNSLEIIRTKKPNKLTVNTQDVTYEGSVAQKIISSMIPSSYYLSQDLNDSFILMTPQNKLLFLENLSLSSYDISEKRKKLKEIIREKEDKSLSLKSNLSLVEDTLKNKKEPEYIPFPLSDKKISEKNREILIKNEHTYLKNCDIRIKKYNKNKDDLLVKLEVYLQTKKLREEKEKINFDIFEITKDIENIQIDDISRLKKILSYLEINQENKKIQEEIDSYENEIKEYSNELSSYNTDLSELDISSISENISTYKSYLSDIEKYISLTEELKQYSSFKDVDIPELERTLFFLSKSYSCPECSSLLSLDVKENKLIKISNDLPSSPDEIKEKIKKGKKYLEINKKINEISSSYDSFSIDDKCDISESLKEEKLLEEKFYFLDKEKKILKEKISFLSDKVKKLKNSLRENEVIDLIESKAELSLDQIREKIMISHNNTSKKKLLEKQLSDLIKKKKNYDESSEIEVNEEEIKSQIISVSEEIEKQEIQRRLHKENISKIEEWRRYLSEKREYDEWKNKRDFFSLQEKENSKRLSAAILLSEKIKDAESLAISNLISSLNSHAKIYLDSFFEDGISVELVAFKEVKKKTKASINLKIEYRGLELDLNSLSGGERDRIILAFTLALSEINNSPILLLDEAIKSLDSETTNLVLSGIRENYKGRLCILIAHQVIEGAFDKIIKIK